MTRRMGWWAGVFALIIASGAVSRAATFSFTDTCTQTTLGPLNLNTLSSSLTGSVTLTPNVASTGLTLISLGLTNQVTSNTVTTGDFSSGIPCVLTLGGVSVNYSRPVSLSVISNPMCSGPGTTGGCLNAGAVTVTVNLGAQGTVTINAPQRTLAGYNTSLGVSSLVVIPGATIDTALLTPAPLPGTPVPPTILLMLTALGAAGAYHARRRLVQVS